MYKYCTCTNPTWREFLHGVRRCIRCGLRPMVRGEFLHDENHYEPSQEEIEEFEALRSARQ